MTSATALNSLNLSQKIHEIKINEETPKGYLPFSEFKEKFSLSETSTEKANPQTANLSETMLKDRLAGLTMLLREEERVIAGFKEFGPQLDPIAKHLAEKSKKGGRIIFIGVGSSGRAGIDLAAKVNSLFPKLNCFGFIGGGDTTLLVAKETFEDSPAQGKAAADKLKLTPEDSVFLISASGSASFNAGFGHAAANAGSDVYYFYNSKEIPNRTKELFTRINNPVKPLLIDIGPQAILGSTRLQGYSIAIVCLGDLLGKTISYIQPEVDASEFSIECLAEKFEQALEKIKKGLQDILKIMEEEYAVFSSTQSNLRRVHDETDKGYVTWLGTERSLRACLINVVEIPPTYFINPVRKETQFLKRRPEYQAYLVGESKNLNAWNTALGRSPYFIEDLKETEEFILAAKADGKESFANRPTKSGNLVVGAEVLRKGESFSSELLETLGKVKEKGGKTALIVISEDLQPDLREKLAPYCDVISIIDGVKDDPLGLTFSQLLKWECNLISNGTMILLGKVLGNRMIDMRTSNNKLINRCMGLIEREWESHHPNESLDEKGLYHLVINTYEKQKTYQERGEYTPSTFKMVLAMLEKNCSFEEAILYLQKAEENIDLLYHKGHI